MKYVALLRGINVSGQKKILMTDLKALFESLNYQNVVTYIQSGNVIFEADSKNKLEMQSQIEQKIKEKYQFQVPTLVISNTEIQLIEAKNPFKNAPNFDESKMYFTFLYSKPNPEYFPKLIQSNEYQIIENTIYMHLSEGYGNTKLNNNHFEKVLKINATTRNLKTVIKLIELCI